MLHTTCLCVTVQQAAGRVLSREDEAREGSDGQDRGVRGTQVTSHHKHSLHLSPHVLVPNVFTIKYRLPLLHD